MNKALFAVPMVAVFFVFLFYPSEQISETEPVAENPTYKISIKEAASGGIGGVATITHKDADGNVISVNQYHNRVVDTGEEFLLDQVFQDGASTADNGSIGAICIGDQGTVTVAETETAADFDGDNTITEANCKEDTTVTTSGGQAVIGPLTFTCGGTNCADGDTITGIAICQNDVTDDGDFNDCATEGIMFSVIDISDVTIGAGESVDIDYTFDVITATS